MALSKITNASVADTAVHGRRNHIINGGFQCWQRSEDKENTGNGWAYWSVDRFQTNKGRFRKTTDTVDGRTVNVLQIDPSSGVYNGGRGPFTIIEDKNVYDKPTVLSAWIKADAATTASFGNLYDYGASQNANSGKTINVTTSWQRFEITYDAQTFTQSPGNYIITGLQDGRTYYIAMAQLEDGDTATPFEHRSFGEELALCQRYFYAEDQSDTYHAVTNGFYSSTTNVITVKHLPVPMRVGPSLSVSGSWQAAGTTGKDASSLIIVDSTGTDIQTVQIRATVSGATAGQGTNLRNKNDATATFHLSAEL